MSVYIIAGVIAVLSFSLVWEGLLSLFDGLIDNVKTAAKDRLQL